MQSFQKNNGRSQVPGNQLPANTVYLPSRFSHIPLSKIDEIERGVSDMCQKAGVNQLKVIFYESTGRQKYSFSVNEKKWVLVRWEALEQLPTEEILGGIAHEIGHLSNSFFQRFAKMKSELEGTSIAIMSYMFYGSISIFRAIKLLAVGLFQCIRLDVLSNLLFENLRISRKGEYLADAFAAQLGHGKGLLDLLKRIQAESPKLPDAEKLEKYSTHPLIEKRIAKLEEILGAEKGD
ncbi:MAG: M48 family metalloprotease [Candidatus Micrarchaeota archaeon]|nr:M48 family metalloprotease [Candidatus Micrarchaeota archaeon]